MSRTVPRMPIVELYDELHQRGISRSSKLKRAQALVADPSPLAKGFADSVAALTSYLPLDEGFYARRQRYEIGDVKATSTTDLALRVRDAGGLAPGPSARPGRVTDDHIIELRLRRVPVGELACVYLDRELVPTRTTGGARHFGTAVRLDLLLANRADRVPVVAEVKRTAEVDPNNSRRVPATDKDPFSALVQALACTAQLATPAQYARLARWGRAERFGRQERPSPAQLSRATPATFDVYVVLHNRPTGTHLPELGAETELLAAQLLAEPAVAQYIRRIACIVTSLKDGVLHSEADWAFERAAGATATFERSFAVVAPTPADGPAAGGE